MAASLVLGGAGAAVPHPGSVGPSPRASQEGTAGSGTPPATPDHSHTDQVMGDSSLQPRPSNLEELDLLMGQKM